MAKKLKSRKSYVTIIDQESNEILGEEFISYSETFDPDEQLLEEIEYDKEGNILGRAVYAYKEKGVLESRESYIEGNVLNEKETYAYQEDGKLSLVELVYSGGGVSRRIYQHEQGQTNIQLEDGEGESEGSEVRYLNDKGSLKEHIIKDEKGEIESRKTVEYNDKDEVAELKLFGRDEGIIEWQTFEYNHLDQEVKRVLYTPNGAGRGGVTLEYNEEGKVIRQKSVDKMSPSGNYERIFSYENNEEWMEMYDGNETLVRQHYKKYDEDERVLLEETSKVPRSSMYTPTDNSSNYFVIRNEFVFWD